METAFKVIFGVLGFICLYIWIGTYIDEWWEHWKYGQNKRG